MEFSGPLDVLFDGDDALGLHRLGKDEQQREKVGVILRLPFRSAQDLAEAGARGQHGLERVADQEGARAGAADHHELERSGLGDDFEMAAGKHEAAEHHAENNQHSDYLEHDAWPTGRRVFWLSRLCTIKLNGLFRAAKKKDEGKGNCRRLESCLAREPPQPCRACIPSATAGC